MSCRTIRDQQGYTLLETLIAAGILVTILASLAQLVAWSVNRVREAGGRSLAVRAAQDKLEQLRTLSWTVDLNGVPVSDAGLVASSLASLDANTMGHVDYLDGTGHVVSGPGAELVRRWAVEPIDSNVPDAIAIAVCVFRRPALHASRRGADVCVSTARVRQP